MPTFDPSAPRQTRKVQGVTLTVPTIFAEGDVLTAATAAWANTALVNETVAQYGNALGRKAKEANTAGAKVKGYVPITAASLADQAAIDAAFASRVLGASSRGSGGSTSSKDPVASMFNYLITESAKARLEKAGKKVMEFYKTKVEVGGKTISKFEEFRQLIIAREGDTFQAQAEAQVQAMAAAAAAETDDLLAELDANTPAQEPAAA